MDHTQLRMALLEPFGGKPAVALRRAVFGTEETGAV